MFRYAKATIIPIVEIGIIEYNTKYNINWIKVKGHADNEYNNRCDELATGEIAKFKA